MNIPNLEEYRYKSEEGDIVVMPCGTKATVKKVDYWPWGAKEITVKPHASWYKRLKLFFDGKTRFTDEDINKLKPIERK